LRPPPRPGIEQYFSNGVFDSIQPFAPCPPIRHAVANFVEKVRVEKVI
jgi:hypothetical protein